MKLDNISNEYIIYGFLFSLSNRIQTIGDNDFKDITLKQHFLLIALEMSDGHPSLREMSDIIGCSYQNVKKMASNLQKNGYINIVQDKIDKRKYLLVGTDKIKEESKRNKNKTKDFMNKLYRDIPKENLDITMKTLMQMDQNIGGNIK